MMGSVMIYILDDTKNKQQQEDLTRRKLLIVFNNKNNSASIYENDVIIPCKECSGKSDTNIDNLTFKNNLLSYTTCIAPFASDKYSVIDFTLQFSKDNFYLAKYKESYFSVEADDSVSIVLDNTDLPRMKFNYYDWVANKSWLDYIIISSHNITKLNDFAFNLGNVNPSVSIQILEKIIKKYPDRVVTYLNIADSYWAAGNKEAAKKNYKQYLSLMKSQKKDLNKVPKYVGERIK
ncbi:tetratricopeptide repeat protein [Chryseobacterium sp. G0240]|nr:tetratricopeptide repeat protein [Chryseobacterium sp. G0240]